MRYFIVFFKYYTTNPSQSGDSALPLELEHYPNLTFLANKIKHIVSSSYMCNQSEVSFGIYSIQEVNGVDFNHFIA